MYRNNVDFCTSVFSPETLVGLISFSSFVVNVRAFYISDDIVYRNFMF